MWLIQKIERVGGDPDSDEQPAGVLVFALPRSSTNEVKKLALEVDKHFQRTMKVSKHWGHFLWRRELQLQCNYLLLLN